jgi:hypothetical protein
MGFGSLYMQSRLIHGSQTEQIKLSAAIQLFFENLQAVDVTFSLAIAPSIG